VIQFTPRRKIFRLYPAFAGSFAASIALLTGFGNGKSPAPQVKAIGASG
jgi:hypothetical protein